MSKSNSVVLTTLLSDEEDIAGATSNKSIPSNTDIMEFLKTMKSELCTKKDLTSLKASLSSDIQLVDNKVEETKSELNTLRSRLEELESRDNLATFRQELQKQRLLRNNLSLMGIPIVPGESLSDIVIKIFASFDCIYTTNDIASVYRTKGENSMIIVKLSSYDSKAAILQAKMKKSTHLSDIGLSEPSNDNNIIFINNHVTPYFGKLLQEGRRAMKENKIHSCWLASSGCMLRLVENGTPRPYRTLQEMYDIIVEPPQQIITTNSKRPLLIASTDTSPIQHIDNKPKRIKKITAANGRKPANSKPKIAKV